MTRFRDAVLSNAWMYDLSQSLVGAPKARQELVNHYLRPEPGMSILDLGCGTADLLPYLSDCRYVGIDISEAYIDRARQRFGEAGRFLVGSVEEAQQHFDERFHLVVGFGLLHHLGDAVISKMLTGVRRLMCDEGRLVTIDPCFVQGQSSLARAVISQDRGNHVRAVSEYLELVSGVFNDRNRHEVRHNLLRIPYSHCIIECWLSDTES